MGELHADKPFVSGVILAAGAAVRMGRPKQLLPLHGRSLLQWVVDGAAASRVDELVVVLGHRAHEILDAIQFPAGRATRVVLNPDYALGQSTSLRAGLRSTDTRAVAAAVLLGDQPGVTGELIDTMLDAFLASEAAAARPLYSRADGRRAPGHPVVLGRRIWSEVEKLSGDQGARVVLSAHPEWLLEVLVEGEPPHDVDTWEDYRRAAGAARRSP